MEWDNQQMTWEIQGHKYIFFANIKDQTQKSRAFKT